MNIPDFLRKSKLSKEGYTSETFSLDESGEPKKPFSLKPYYLSFIIILVATLSFGIGRLSVTGGNTPIKIEYDKSLDVSVGGKTEGTASAITALEKSSSPSQAVTDTTVVASSKSTKYHFLHCPGAKQISEKNKITFSTTAAAETSGYTLAANCSPR
jgi:hypothetical protein